MNSSEITPFFSIIVPVYNVAAYLTECVNSILAQKFESFELLLINDGSTDASGELCESFCLIDSRAKVFHRENKGLSAARNFGIEQSNGTYVVFVDSDDLIHDDGFLSDLYSAITTNDMPDVALYPNYLKLEDASRKYLNAKKCSCNSNCSLSGKNDLSRIVRDGFIPVAAWGKAVNKFFIDKINLKFVEGEKSEDFEWTFNILRYAETYIYLSEYFYVYRIRAGSISGSMDDDALVTLKRQITRLVKYASNENDSIVSDVLYSYISDMFVTYLICLASTGKWQVHIDEAKKLDYLFRYSHSSRGRMVRTARLVFGYPLTFRMLAFAFRFTSSGRRHL